MTKRWRLIASGLLLSSALLIGLPAVAGWLPNLMSKEEEAQVGAKEAPKVAQEFGGEYDDLELSKYVTSVGQFLASASNEPGKYTFTILDSPIVNAFALPGGYVFVTRGLLALADDEAEMAGVLAHEIGHVTAHHAAERYSQSIFAQLGLGILGAVTGSDLVGQVGGAAAQLALRGYSRENEFEADTLGVTTMSRAGFNPDSMSTFLAKLQANDKLQAEIAGDPGAADSYSLLSTHPRTADRVNRAIEQAGAVTVREPIIARDVYLSKIDGIIYGDNPDQGVIRGRNFIHPKLRFEFEVPQGYQMINTAQAVLAQREGGGRIIFDFAARTGDYSMAAYLTSVWGQKVKLQQVESINVNGMPAATAWARVNSKEGQQDIRLVAIAFDEKTIARFFMQTPPKLTADLSEGLKATTYSFRRISAEKAAAIKPYRVKIITVAAGDTVASLAAKMPFTNFQEQRFRVLNGLGPNDALTPGSLAKTVVAE